MTFRFIFLTVLAALSGPIALFLGADITPGQAVFAGILSASLTFLSLRVWANSRAAAPPMAHPPAQNHDKSHTDIDRAARPALQVLPAPVVLVGAQDRVIFANEAAQQIYRGYEPGSVLSTMIRHPEVLGVYRKAVQSMTPCAALFTINRPEERHMRVLALPVRARQTVLFFHDETDARKAEQMRAGFLADASHELRTPLASLSGYIETLRTTAKDDAQAQAKFLHIMAGQAAHMESLINDLLSLSQIEMNEHLAPQDNIDIKEVIQSVCAALTPLAEARKVILQINASDGPLPVIADQRQIIQVVQNLVDNAIKYSPPEGAVTITISADHNRRALATQNHRLGPKSARIAILETPQTPGVLYTMVHIQDAGPGIAAEHLPRLAGRFYRVEAGKTQSRKGTGLGLAIVKHIMTRHRGGLRVESLPGAGSVFTVVLPQSPAQQTSRQRRPVT